MLTLTLIASAVCSGGCTPCPERAATHHDVLSWLASTLSMMVKPLGF